MVYMLLLAGCGQDSPPPVSQLPDFTQLVKQASPAVVNISALPAAKGNTADDEQNQGSNPLEGWLRRFFQDGPGENDSAPPPPPGPGANPHPSLGSGFIISDDGYILTNRHVIENADQIVVKLNDRRQLLATVVGQDSYSDLAVLKVKAEDLPTVKIGDPSKLQVGSWVVAIGSPFGFETSVTAGIVSAKQRNLASDQYVPFLQTDVAINPGNSGGPLFDLAGQVVGINSQIYSQTGGYQGVSFAIPIDIAMDVAQQLRKNGNVTRGWLGVQIQDIDRELAKSFKLKRPEGALVARVLPDSPAASAKLQPGDVILEFNGKAVNSAAALPPLVGSVAPGKDARVTVLRNEDRQNINVTIKPLPKDLVAASSGQPSGPQNKPAASTYGMTLKALDDDEREQLELDRGGVKVVNIKNGPAARAGLQAGDVILAAGSTPVDNIKSLRGLLDDTDGPVALLILREGNRLYLPMQTGSQESG